MKEKDNNIKAVTFLPLFLGMLCGVIIYIIFYGKLFSDFDYSLLIETNQSFVIYILKERLVQLSLFLLIAFVISYYLSAFVFCCFIGVSYGLIYSYFFTLYYVKGICITWIIFIPIILFYFGFIYLFGRFFFYKNKCLCNNFNKFVFLLKIFVIIIFFLFGVSVELYLHNFFELFFSICSRG